MNPGPCELGLCVLPLDPGCYPCAVTVFLSIVVAFAVAVYAVVVVVFTVSAVVAIVFVLRTVATNVGVLVFLVGVDVAIVVLLCRQEI